MDRVAAQTGKVMILPDLGQTCTTKEMLERYKAEHKRVFAMGDTKVWPQRLCLLKPQQFTV